MQLNTFKFIIEYNEGHLKLNIFQIELILFLPAPLLVFLFLINGTTIYLIIPVRNLTCTSLSVLLLYFFWLCHTACRIFSDQRSNPCPLHWEHGVLTAGPPGKSSAISDMFLQCIHFSLLHLANYSKAPVPFTSQISSLIFLYSHLFSFILFTSLQLGYVLLKCIYGDIQFLKLVFSGFQLSSLL